MRRISRRALISIRQEIGVYYIAEAATRGRELARSGGLPQEEGWLVIKYGTFRVDKIIKIEPYRKGADNYQIVMATYSASWTPEYKRAMELFGDSVSEERKMKVLLKHDPFKSSWTVSTFDAANRDAEFKTDYVAQALASPFGQ